MSSLLSCIRHPYLGGHSVSYSSRSGQEVPTPSHGYMSHRKRVQNPAMSALIICFKVFIFNLSKFCSSLRAVTPDDTEGKPVTPWRSISTCRRAHLSQAVNFGKLVSIKPDSAFRIRLRRRVVKSLCFTPSITLQLLSTPPALLPE